MGPIKGEPYCPCKMQTLGLRIAEDYEWSAEEKEAFTKALEQYGWKTDASTNHQTL